MSHTDKEFGVSKNVRYPDNEHLTRKPSTAEYI